MEHCACLRIRIGKGRGAKSFADERLVGRYEHGSLHTGQC